MNINELKEIKVSINELISLANYSIIEGIVPSYESIKKDFLPVWVPLYLDESLKNNKGKHCYIIKDNCYNKIKAIVVQPNLNKRTKTLLIDIMDNIIYDLLYQDIIEQIGGKTTEFTGEYSSLLDYIKKHSKTQDKISNYEYSWLLILAEGRLDLLEL